MLDLIVLARDEADRLPSCLASAPGARAWVLDSGSTDGTRRVAERLGATVIATDWPGFPAQRARALAIGEAPFQLFLDADEALAPGAWAAILAAVARPGSTRGWSLARRTVWLGRELRHGRVKRERHVRVIRRGAGRWTGAAVHERLEVDGPVAALPVALVHEPYRHLGEHLRTIDRYSALKAHELRARGRRARRGEPSARAAWHLARAVALDQAWRDGLPGLAFAALGAVCTGVAWSRSR